MEVQIEEANWDQENQGSPKSEDQKSAGIFRKVLGSFLD